MANLETTAEINKLLKEQNKILAAQAKVMKSQAVIMKSVVESMQKIAGMDTTESLNEMNKALKDADKALQDLSGTQQKAYGDINKSAKQSNKHLKSMSDKIASIGKKSAMVAVLATSFSGLSSGVRLGLGLFESMLSVAGTLAKSFFNLGASIIAIPFKILNNLMGRAAQMSGGELRQAIEDLRKEMGDLSTNEGKAVMDSFRHMRKEGTMTGLRLYSVFGDMANRLKEMTRIAVAMGRSFTSMTDEFMQHGRQIGEYVKGLGLSDEGIRAVTKRAQSSGKEFIEISREITTMAFGMGDAFGINGKLISKDIAEMVGDFENFGSVGIKQMSQVAVYTRRLGIEVKDLLGVIGKFDDFETAAQSAAQLSQAFGLQVDTLEMLKEQDPAARFESLRKAFLATGRSVEGLTRQELSLLSTQTGISAEALKLGFSQSKAGMSYEEVQKQAGLTEKKQLSQAEAMEKLSMSIELLVHQGQQMEGGFFNIFLQGFDQGARHSGHFYKLMMQLHRAMRATFQVGREVGMMFMQYFPGVNDIFENMTEVFAKIGGFRRTSKGMVAFGFLGDVLEDFRKFFKALTTDPRVALKELFKNLQKDFFSHFSTSKQQGMKILGGFKMFFKAMSGIFAAGLEMAMHGVAHLVHLLTDLIKDPSKLMKGSTAAGSGMYGTILDMLKPMFEAVQEAWPELQHAFVELWHVAVEKFGPKLKELGEKALGYLKTAAIGASVSRLIFSSVMFGVAKAGEMIIAKGSPLLGKAFSNMFEKTSKIPDIKSGAEKMQSALSGTTGMAESMKKADATTGKINWKALGKNLLIGIGAIALTAGAMALAYLGLRSVMKDVSIQDVEKANLVIKSMAMMFAAAAGVVLASVATGALLAIPTVAPLALIGLAALAGVTLGMVKHVKGIIKEIDSISGLSGGIDKKVDIFVKVASALTNFGSLLLDIMKQATPSFSGLVNLFRGKNPMEDGLKAAANLMSTMSTHIKDIVVLIATVTRGITPEQIQAGSMIATVMNAMTELLKAFVPPPELTPSLFDKMFDKKSLERITNYMKETMTAMKDKMIPAVSDMMMIIAGSGLLSVDKEKIDMFSSFISGLSSLLQALQPSEGMTNLLKETENNNFWSKLVPWGKSQEKAGEGASVASNVIGDMLKNITGPDGVITKVQTLMGSIVDSVSKLGDAEKIKSSTELFSVVMKSITDISEMFSGDTMKNFQAAVSSGQTANIFNDFNKNMLIPMSQQIPETFTIFEQMHAALNTVKNAYTGKVASGLKDLVSEINSISSTLSKVDVQNIEVQMKDLSDKLGLKGNKSLVLDLNDINLTINVEVKLDADKFEESLRTRPGGSKFYIKGTA